MSAGYPLTDETEIEVWVGLQKLKRPWSAITGWFVPADAKVIATSLRATGGAQFHDVAFVHPDAKAN